MQGLATGPQNELTELYAEPFAASAATTSRTSRRPCTRVREARAQSCAPTPSRFRNLRGRGPARDQDSRTLTRWTQTWVDRRHRTGAISDTTGQGMAMIVVAGPAQGPSIGPPPTTPHVYPNISCNLPSGFRRCAQSGKNAPTPRVIFHFNKSRFVLIPT